jgi:hypothetical protein
MEWFDKWTDRVSPSGQVKRSLSVLEKTEVWVYRAAQVHDNKYSYENSVYSTSKSKLSIKCPEHGDFIQQAASHLNGGGCPKCCSTCTYSTEEFISRAKEVQVDRYDYSLVKYTTSKTKVKILCPEHGEFAQTPNAHLKGSGCPNCYGNQKSSTEEFTTKAGKLHGELYDYSLVDYTNSRTKVKILCHEHGEFEQTPYSHINDAAGCPSCAVHNILYILNELGTTNYKIGVTTNSPFRRVKELQRSLGRELVLVSYIEVENPRTIEAEIHALGYINPYAASSEKFDGHTEYRCIPNITPILEEYFNASI